MACLVAALALPATVLAQANAAADNGSPAPATSQGLPPDDFSRPVKASIPSPAVLRAYLRLKLQYADISLAGRRQHFCFVQQRSAPPEDPSPFVWMIWQDGGEILSLGSLLAPAHATPQEAEEHGEGMARNKSIRLATGVRETAEEITGSSFLVERAWVDRLLAQCQAKGRKVEVRPRR